MDRTLVNWILVGLFLVIINVLMGFNYLKSFSIASSFEHPRSGLWMYIDTKSYLVTRIQDVLEPLVFFTPFLSVYLIWAIKKSKDMVYKGGILLFLGFLLTGAYYTGETARAAIFMLPLLVLIIAENVKKKEVWLLYAVFFQTLLMQLFGWFVW